MPGRLILVRHGESEGNATRTFTLSDEVPLTDLGRTQARSTAEILRGRFAPVRLISSPFRRARQTADEIASTLGLPIEIEPDVREQHLGELRGRPYEEALGSPGFAEPPRWEWRPPGGETLAEVLARSLVVLERIARAHPKEHVVVVSHGGTITAVWAHAARSWEPVRSVPNAGILVVPHDGQRLRDPTLVPLEDL